MLLSIMRPSPRHQASDMHVLRTALQKELGICYPIGAVLGGLAAMANEHLRAGGGAGTAGACRMAVWVGWVDGWVGGCE